jgi:proline iminopeptidase
MTIRNRKSFFLFFIFFGLLQSCKKEKIKLGSHVSEIFYLKNEGANMRVLVEGNTKSKTLLLFIHGGPGSSSYFYNTDYISENIEDKYAVVYWDQRNAGASQGNKAQFDLELMTNDTEKIIKVLKHRYGNDISVFMLGHSFGGLLSSSYMTKGLNQFELKGWIFCSASHNYQLNDQLTIEGIKYFGEQQLALGKHTDDWTKILNFVNQLPNAKLTLAQANQLNTYANNTQSYFDEVKPFPLTAYLKANALSQNYSIISTLINLRISQNSEFNETLANYEFSSKLSEVTIPVLSIFGKYDLICPPKLGIDVLNNVSSTVKSSAIMENSSHVPMYQDQEKFCEAINQFIEENK